MSVNFWTTTHWSFGAGMPIAPEQSIEFGRIYGDWCLDGDTDLDYYAFEDGKWMLMERRITDMRPPDKGMWSIGALRVPVTAV